MFLTGNAQDVPAALLHNMKHNKVLHDQNVILTIVTEEVPRLPDEGRVTVEKLSDRFSRVTVRFGFMESPNLPKALGRRTSIWRTCRSSCRGGRCKRRLTRDCPYGRITSSSRWRAPRATRPTTSASRRIARSR